MTNAIYPAGRKMFEDAYAAAAVQGSSATQSAFAAISDARPVPEGPPSWLEKKPAATKIQPMQTELQIQRAQFEGALAILIGQIDQLPARLAKVMTAGDAPEPHEPASDAGTPLGAWLQRRTAEMQHATMRVRGILDRIDL